MAVYTPLSHSDISAFLADYDIGELTEFKGIADGVSNTNYLLTTSPQPLAVSRYILTIFEKRTNAADLPFFMNLTEHLASRGIPCPRPIHAKNGRTINTIKDKPAVLVEFLQGAGNPEISEKHLQLLGEIIAKFHIATSSFTENRDNELGLAGIKNIFIRIQSRLNEISDGLENELEKEFLFLENNIAQNLPKGVIHADIFPDNVFFSADEEQITGIIDFYFSCTDFLAYDLAIVLNAWCFNADGKFVPARADALLSSYNKIRPLSEQELATLPMLGRLAALRFLLTRAYDMLNQVEGAVVKIKDPMEYVKKLHFWQKEEWNRDNRIIG